MTNFFGITRVREGLLTKEFSAREIASEALRKAGESNAKYNSYISISEELALSLADALDEKIKKGEHLPALAGVPVSIKDALLVKGERCTAGSLMLEDYTAPYDATAVAKIKEAGAVIIGKTNMDEFAMGGSNENSAYGPVKNPRSPERVPGGSSGGSAASVADESAVFSLGSDTGGSIRQPASFCGVTGLKPTYGAVSRHGLIAMASSLDQIGPLARTVEDAEAVFRVISGKDEHDATSMEYNPEENGQELKPLRIGVPKEYFGEGLASAVKKVIEQALERLAKSGAVLLEVELPSTAYALAAYYMINTSEISSNLSRYDGARYGYSAQGQDLFSSYAATRGKGFGNEVKRRIILGTYALSAGYYDAYYVKAQKIRSLIKRDFDRAFEKVDIIAGPVSPVVPFKIGEKVSDPLAMYLVDMYTVPANLAGLPAISVPAGTAEGLPAGLHMIAPAFRENLLFAAGKILQNMQY
ncbi:MAG: Asp-tRNA(Asn)/Glu-tRNA(Gln) amidotransferase subunit GatA [Candidatus Wildermuthbacteria bacterium]|nr:Asp-tRNA(Asn)/Glu-tRNA(Gln) amidotransferase subunit GatA [Candidatus Wildermuthbacteria bacterium]